jgi:hypothetical protein
LLFFPFLLLPELLEPLNASVAHEIHRARKGEAQMTLKAMRISAYFAALAKTLGLVGSKSSAGTMHACGVLQRRLSCPQALAVQAGNSTRRRPGLVMSGAFTA